MATRAEVVSDGAKRSEKLLGVCWGFEAPEHPFSSAGGPMRVLRPVIQPFVPPVLRLGQYASQGRRIGIVTLTSWRSGTAMP